MLCGMRRPALMRACSSRHFIPLCLPAVGCAALMLTAGCGQIGTSGTNSTSSSSSTSSVEGAYLSCLHEHGVSAPTASATGEPGSRGPATSSSTFEKAQETCAPLLPGGEFAVAFQAFRSCMSSHGETIPSTLPTVPPTSGTSSPDRFLLDE